MSSNSVLKQPFATVADNSKETATVDPPEKQICEKRSWKKIRYDRWRLGYVRGFSGGYVKEYTEANAHCQRIIDRINDINGTARAFDVTTKGILHYVWKWKDEFGGTILKQLQRGEHRSKTRPNRDRVGPKLRTEDQTEMVRSGPGDYIPQLAELMVQFDKKHKIFNLKGIALGKLVLEHATDLNSRAEFFGRVVLYQI
uniref:Serine carboxypeptidase-like 45 n=1 Tax=Tanacetum cinerariifolium TaxID=118510 RepID=A0A6L2JLN8_TANCI|nr:serine carboxypeptidase-like 45 [Tanacetum cinerariifolium]